MPSCPLGWVGDVSGLRDWRLGLGRGGSRGDVCGSCGTKHIATRIPLPLLCARCPEWRPPALTPQVAAASGGEPWQGLHPQAAY